MAREIQSQFLPNQLDIAGENMELFARCVPLLEKFPVICTIFFNYLSKRLAFCVGDVSGKGVSAALFMIAVRNFSPVLNFYSYECI
jgi:serine phosphatase RsbU (regulator of sigma subunit)